MSPADSERSVVLGNVYNKYESRNPVARFLFDHFLRSFRRLLSPLEVTTILEVGCGEGYLSRRIAEWRAETRIVGIDLTPALFDREIAGAEDIAFSAQSAYALGFRDRSFDLVVGAEVLEHLETPESALQEICRVSRRFVLLSVPREPIWKAMNLARFSYIRQWGNTPGHVQAWSSRRFVRFVSTQLDVVTVLRPLPWTMVLARVPNDAGGKRSTP